MLVSAIPSQCHDFDKFDEQILDQRGFKSKICIYVNPQCKDQIGRRLQASWRYTAGSWCALDMYIALCVHEPSRMQSLQ